MFYIGFKPSRDETIRTTKGTMTQLEVRYRYVDRPTEREMRAIDAMREVYGIRKIAFNEQEKVVKVEFDASRLKEPNVAALLRRAGMDLKERLILA